MKRYNSPKLTEYGDVNEITEFAGDDKEGTGGDEYDNIVPLSGSIEN